MGNKGCKVYIIDSFVNVAHIIVKRVTSFTKKDRLPYNLSAEKKQKGFSEKAEIKTDKILRQPLSSLAPNGPRRKR